MMIHKLHDRLGIWKTQVRIGRIFLPDVPEINLVYNIVVIEFQCHMLYILKSTEKFTFSEQKDWFTWIN